MLKNGGNRHLRILIFYWLNLTSGRYLLLKACSLVTAHEHNFYCYLFSVYCHFNIYKGKRLSKTFGIFLVCGLTGNSWISLASHKLPFCKEEWVSVKMVFVLYACLCACMLLCIFMIDILFCCVLWSSMCWYREKKDIGVERTMCWYFCALLSL